MKTATKKFISVLISVMLVLSCIPMSALAVDGSLPESSLQNFWLLLNDESETEIKVAYLGGSVTVGSGASDISKTSWRALVGQWLIDNYGPGTSYNKNITNVNAAIGATGSYFGSYRAWKDCEFGSDNPPDILFIEFAINDIYDVIGGEKTAINYESIIRQAYKANPKINIITVFTMDNNIAYSVINKNGNEDSEYFAAQRAVAAHYGLPQIDVGKALIKVINDEYVAAGKTFSASDSSDASSIWRQYITDACHPGDAGYQIYANTITDYLEQQLGENTSHTAAAVSVDLESTPSYASAKGNDKNLKENGRYISFKDAGFTQADLHGWTLSTKAGESSLSSSNGKISTNLTGASFAFKFTGTAVGFFNFGKPSSGTINYTITSTADPEKQYEGSVSLVKNYNGGLPFPGELMTGLDNEEWLVECILQNGASGCDGNLYYIYIDGETDTISPAAAPETNLPPIVIDAEKFTAENSAVLGAIVEKDGLKGKIVTPDTSSGGSADVDNFNYNTYDTKITFPQNKFIGITYYLENNDAGKVQNIVMALNQLKNSEGAGSGWLTGTEHFPNEISIKAAPVVSDKWVTQYFDFTEFAEAAAEYYPGYFLYQARHYPFGQIPANTVTNGETHYLNSITYYTSMPYIYNADGTQSMINDGSQTAYVSANESTITVDGKVYNTYSTISEAVNALSPVGGTIKVKGEASWSDGTIDRKKITVEGLDDSAKLTNISIAVLRGDLELKNITMVGHNDEYWSYTSGHKLILGEGFSVENAVRPAASSAASGKPNIVDVYSGKLLDFAAAGGYGSTFTITGDTIYNIYGGKVSGIAGISRNGAGSGVQTVNGDIYYNIYGGEISGSLASSTTSAVLNGNLWYIVNGGTFASGSSIDFGNRQAFTATEARNLTINGSQIIIINNKEINESGGSISNLSLGKNLNSGIYNSDCKKFVIINNSELSSDTGASIASACMADYQLLVNGGKATPKFDSSNQLIGFDLVPDEEGSTPYLGDEMIMINENGFYTIEPEAGVTKNINFKSADSIDIIFSDGADNTVNMVAKQNSAFSMPSCTFTKDGYYFTGWKTDGDEKIYIPGDVYPLGMTGVTFVAQWRSQDELDKVYVDSSVSVSGTGLIKSSPVKSIDEAIKVGGESRDFTIVFLNEYIGPGYTNMQAHTGMITFSSEDDGLLVLESQYLKPNGPSKFENIRLKVPGGNTHISVNANDIIIGEGIEFLPADDGKVYYPAIHAGKENNNTPYHYIEIDGGIVRRIYAGSFYNTSATEPDISEGAKVTVNGGEVQSLQFGPDGYSGHNGPVTWTNSPSLVLNGGKVSGITKGSCTVVYDAPVQIVVNNGLEVPDVSGLGTPEAGIITVISDAGGYVDATETSGVFEIITDSETLYINGELTEKTPGNLYTLNTPGTYYIGYSLCSFSFESGASDASGEAPSISPVISGTNIELPANKFTRSGYTFAGWYNGSSLYDENQTITASGESMSFRAMWKNTLDNRSFVSEDGYADADNDGMEDVIANNTFAKGMDEITSSEGGTLYVEGNVTGSIDGNTFYETNNSSRGAVLVRGINDNISENSISVLSTVKNFSKGDITFDYITLNAPSDEFFLSVSDGYTMTFGENIAVKANGTRNIYVGGPWTSTGGKYVFNGGVFSYVTSGGSYDSGATITGDVESIFNDGVFNEVFGGARNGNGAATASKHVLNGNVFYTFNGGTYNNNIYLGSLMLDKVLGNIIFTVNGGNFEGRSIISGHRKNTEAITDITPYVCGGDNVVIVNNKNIDADDNISSLTLGKSGSGINVGGDEIYIINNYELNTGVSIAEGSAADYKIRVSGGSAKPVYAQGTAGARLGFELTSDIEGLMPYANGVKLEKNSDGLYDLTANTSADGYIDITFEGEGYLVSIGRNPVTVADDYTVTVEQEGIVDFTAYPSPEKAGGLFLGWYYDDDTAVEDGSMLTAGTKITAKYYDFSTDVESGNFDFGVLGAQVRLSDSADLRFVNKFTSDVRNALIAIDEAVVPDDSSDTGVGYGFVVLPSDLLTGDLTKDTQDAGIVPAVKIFNETDSEIMYTVCITGIVSQNYSRDYTVVPYITYLDAQGIQHTVYGEQYAANLAEIAGLALDNESESLTPEQIQWLTEIAGR